MEQQLCCLGNGSFEAIPARVRHLYTATQGGPLSLPQLRAKLTRGSGFRSAKGYSVVGMMSFDTNCARHQQNRQEDGRARRDRSNHTWVSHAIDRIAVSGGEAYQGGGRVKRSSQQCSKHEGNERLYACLHIATSLDPPRSTARRPALLVLLAPRHRTQHRRGLGIPCGYHRSFQSSSIKVGRAMPWHRTKPRGTLPEHSTILG